jgi:NADPH-dependent 2,4-dienoyl-CoA reductase/sulfur reductase-like enzyme
MKYLILGNGPTGVIAAETLRHADPGGDIVMAGNEKEPPYSRMAIPYLLEGTIGEEGTYLRKSAGHYASLRIGLREGRAVALDPAQKSVLFHDGSRETYDRLLVATGSRPIRLPIPGIDLPQVQTCWTLEDARAIARLAKAGSRVLQVGAGFIGCIIMESLHARGVKLTVVERGDRMVPRMMTPVAGNMIKTWVESKGIRVVTSAGIERIDPAPAKAEATSMLGRITRALGGGRAAEAAADPTGEVVATLSTGEQIACDLVIVAAGVAPNVAFLDQTGVHVASGVLVNDRMETSVPGIFAAGDVAEAPDLLTGAHLVAAIQPNAADQARIAALNMSGQPARLPGVLAINVLDSLGLISSSFGQWWGNDTKDGVELVDRERYRYVSLQFNDDVLIGATSLGLTQHVGVIRGLIQNRTRLGHWKRVLKDDPLRFPEAYVACSQTPTTMVHASTLH